MTSSRTAKAILNRSFSKAESAIVLFDSDRQIVYANPKAEAMLGFEIEQLSSVKAGYHHLETDNPIDSIVSRISPPPEIVEGQVSRASREIFLTASEHPPLMMDYFLLEQSEGPKIILAIVSEGGSQSATDGRLEEKLVVALQDIQRFRETRVSLEHFVGESAASKQILLKSEAAVSSGANVVICGPDGSGREHLARSIHQAWRMKHEHRLEASPLVTVDGAIADAETMQAAIRELFQFQEGVTATNARILLTNADRLEPNAQLELSGILTLRDYDIGVLATSANSLLLESDFEPTLAAMLSIVEINVPPLSQRLSDIPILSQYFLEKHNADQEKQYSGFTDGAMEQLIQYYWPGNVDELSEVIRYACQHSKSHRIEAEALPRKIPHALLKEEHPVEEDFSIDLDEFLKSVESELIERAMNKAKGNKSKAAELLGINRARLIRRWSQIAGEVENES